jgi:hypothetical protein
MYTVAQTYFTENPNGTATLGALTNYGYNQTVRVSAVISNGAITALVLTASHSSGNKTYTVNSAGVITNN